MKLSATGPFRLFAQMKQILTGFGHQQNAFLFAVCVIVQPNASRVAIAKVDSATGLLRDARCQCHLHSAVFDPIFKSANTSHVRGMRENAPRIVLENDPTASESSRSNDNLPLR